MKALLLLLTLFLILFLISCSVSPPDGDGDGDGGYIIKIDPRVEFEYKQQLTQINERLTQIQAAGAIVQKNVGIVPEKSFSMPTLHGFIAVDLADPSIGASVRIDLTAVKLELQRIAKETKLPLDNRIFTGETLTPGHIKTTIKKAIIDKDDIVFFYYSGHGLNNSEGSGSEWPDLFLSGQFLPLQQIIAALKAKGPRLLLVIADACNNLYSKPPIMPETKTIRHIPNKSQYTHLFMRHKGIIVAVGAKKGHVSWGSSWEGGFFTNALLKAMRSKNKTWRGVMTEAIRPITIPGQHSFQYPYRQIQIQATD